MRPREIGIWDWSVTDPIGPHLNLNIEAFFRTDPYYRDILTQFVYYKCDYEVSIRINTNQMYYGALMAILFPGEDTTDINYLNQRSVCSPVVMSAMSEGTGTLTLKWPFPWEWNKTTDFLEPQLRQTVRLIVDIIAPLTKSSAALGDSVSIIVTGRMVNPYVLLNRAQDEESEVKLQSSKKVTTRGKTPFDDAQVYADKHIPELSEPLKLVSEMVSTVGSSLPMITSVLSLFDKPESQKEARPVLVSHAQDLSCVDRPIYSALLGMYQDSYLSTEEGILPFKSDWTMSEYAQLPAIIRTMTFTNSTTPAEFTLGPSPCLYALATHFLWRGSIKFRFDFYTSMFTTARLVIRLVYRPNPNDDADWQNSIIRMVDVKGDTSVEVTVPFVNDCYWTPTQDFATEPAYAQPWALRIYPISRVISNDASVEASIRTVVWAAAGPDFQVAGPKQVDWPLNATWLGPITPPELPGVKLQSAMTQNFAKDFQPFADGACYATDSKYCTGDATRAVTDLLKRYQQVTPQNLPRSTALLETDWAYNQFARMFLMHRGGLNVFARYTNATQVICVSSAYGPSITANPHGGILTPDSLGVARVTLPFTTHMAFELRSTGRKPIGLGIRSIAAPLSMLCAVRDDWKVAFPVLPPPILPTIPPPAPTDLSIVPEEKKARSPFAH